MNKSGASSFLKLSSENLKFAFFFFAKKIQVETKDS